KLALGGTDSGNGGGGSGAGTGGEPTGNVAGSADAGGTPADPGPGPMGGAAGTMMMMPAGGKKPAMTVCMPATERCNGHDDNCNDVVDEQACNSRANNTTGCAGFVTPSRPDHGYMLCTTTPKDYVEAQAACEQQSMRLAWLESEAENTEVSTKVHALTDDEVSFGATDAAVEGDWLWDGAGGFQFWKGDENGEPVGGAFNKWAPGTPNDDNGGEDCAVLNAANGFWGDRACSIQYAYLCEEPEP
ncbi:MAG TPA: C-type lectin domain-containing protein, partial [Polyangiaceae bacterium]|nr:C-type lectin domain-containing protein [Polyangiaceae bacterium]